MSWSCDLLSHRTDSLQWWYQMVYITAVVMEIQADSSSHLILWTDRVSEVLDMADTSLTSLSDDLKDRLSLICGHRCKVRPSVWHHIWCVCVYVRCVIHWYVRSPLLDPSSHLQIQKEAWLVHNSDVITALNIRKFSFCYIVPFTVHFPSHFITCTYPQDLWHNYLEPIVVHRETLRMNFTVKLNTSNCTLCTR